MKRSVPPGTDNCIFCGGRPTTREHVYSAWSHRYLTKKPGRWIGTVGSQTIQGGKELKKIKGKGDIHDWQVKCVCEKRCNNGWMRELENRARPILTPMIEGKKCRLSPNDQRAIAGWVCLKAIVGEHEHPGMVSWDAAARSRLMRFRLPPAKDCVIVAGFFSRGTAPMHWVTFPMLFLPGERNRGRLGEPAAQFNMAATTQVIGKALFHLIHAAHLRQVIRRFGFTPEVTTKLRMIWPVTGTYIDWPPDPLTDAEAEYVAGALFNKLDNASRRAFAAGKS